MLAKIFIRKVIVEVKVNLHLWKNGVTDILNFHANAKGTSGILGELHSSQDIDLILQLHTIMRQPVMTRKTCFTKL